MGDIEAMRVDERRRVMTMLMLTGLPERKLLPPAPPADLRTVIVTEEWTRYGVTVKVGRDIIYRRTMEPPFVLWSGCDPIG